MELVDILEPPTFKKSGIAKPRNEAISAGDWIGTFNLWIVQTKPISSVIYQIRSPNSSWAPDLLDVTAGGHYQAGEEIMDGLREVEEELGKKYEKDDLHYLGRKVHISPDVYGHERHNIVEIFITEDNSSLSTYKLESNEVYAVCACPINELIKVHTENSYLFEVEVVISSGDKKIVKVTKDSFPYNWDNYHFKIALLAQRYVNGETNLVYY